MSKNTALKITNAVLAVLILTQMLSGFFRASIPYKAFSIVHKDGAIVLLIVVITHIILNRNWIVSAYFRK